jgi:uncharacterized phage-associated protein
MAYTSKQVANEFIDLAMRDGRQLTPMQLQKLVYFAYGWYLAITGKRLLDERVEAWRWGPVVPSLYSEFKPYGSGPITEPAADFFFDDAGKMSFKTQRIGNSPDDITAKQIIAKVWQIYGKYTASQLSAMTHEPNSPWSLTEEKDVKGTDIDDQLITNYFRRLAHGHAAAAVR